MKNSIIARLVIMFAAAALIIFSLIGSVLYAVVNNELLHHERNSLATTFKDIEYMVSRAGTTERWAHVQAKLDTLTPADGKVRFWIFSDDPRFGYGKDLAELHEFANDPNHLGRMSIKGKKYPLHTLTKILPAYLDRPTIRLTVGVDAASYFETLRTFVAAMTGLSLAGVLLVILCGYWIARTGLQPLKKMSDKAQTLSPKTLSERLTLSALPDELSDLAQAFNGALDRMENAYKQLEAFNADVAHELRTPLANLIGETQVALSRERSAPEFESVLQSNLEEMDRLRSIINDMLFLARCDQGEAATGLVHALIADEVQKTMDFFEFVLDETGMRVEISGDTHATALIETSLFRRALTNLLQNAIQHSPAGACIEVAIDAKNHGVQIAVSNPGEPVEQGHLPRLFDRFYRVDTARRDINGIHGHGLGLAIVKAIALMHGGSVFAASTGGVTTIGFTTARF
ncbi:heavy metal sensor histidine kinase [Verminephrobacter eiseniae]|uniref:heavy metal sensor histidine kinase n=1 Tax=Verminephrobacter eiseniae TaxID=364317 RepID=UPI0010D49038|nr:heavy metal sensor histidine kinase [Verminephrobacter eiseniae]KAB7598066.1 heavy metal sensor histidine kinase [Verminephrobacter sp. Larva24]MCW5233168.1 HAMP domain-containing protein [Verminephrobacter eiseniae]MCW5295277.1 HAMP domain-containing protein [Verminephrobacter eiseniae]MCW8185680.1 HAMP domain-containing protein [Verminephrobacter eiseniae]MCW8224580.1 HAMP domain-containing protein [Verminephrobacter eiseniae]